MNGAAAQMFIISAAVAYSQLFSGVAGGSGGDDDPRRPWHPPSVHQADAQRRQQGGEEGPYSCPICHRRFQTEKAVHGHMRCHPDRAWRGMEEPGKLVPVAVDANKYRYACEYCGAQFETRQALGGHRASHSGKMGCFKLSRQPAEPKPVFPFDLNEPAPEEEEQEG